MWWDIHISLYCKFSRVRTNEENPKNWLIFGKDTDNAKWDVFMEHSAEIVHLNKMPAVKVMHSICN